MAEVKPPPLPLPPAGFGWRTLACLADIIPLIILGVFLGGYFANTEQLEAKQRVDDFQKRLEQQYIKTLSNPSEREQTALRKMIMQPDTQDVTAVQTWYTHQGVVCFFVLLVGLALQEIVASGQTIGKRIFNLRTVDFYTQQSPGMMSCFLRSAWKAAFLALVNPLILILGIINFHIPLFRRDRRAWHDMLTRTYVVDDKKK